MIRIQAANAFRKSYLKKLPHLHWVAVYSSLCANPDYPDRLLRACEILASAREIAPRCFAERTCGFGKDHGAMRFLMAPQSIPPHPGRHGRCRKARGKFFLPQEVTEILKMASDQGQSP
jgi:hypothetical protein